MPPNLLNRVLRIFNLAAAVAAVCALAAVGWYGWRPLAKTSGSAEAPVLARVTIARDSLGVPHIRAASEADVLFAQGYATAQDRLFQMEAMRRLAAGTLAEVLGPAAVESDREARRLRLRRLAGAAYLTLPAAERAALAAYARGVEHFIATHRGRLPVEFTLLGYEPRPWSVVDCLLIGLHMFRTQTTTWKDELAKRNMLASGNREKVEFLFPARGGGEAQPGSNAWVVAGARTASGKPLLSNDPHLEWTLPGAWYMTRLQAGELDVSGVTIPGIPGILIGHNRRIAWGVTSLLFDVQDLYAEKIDDRTGRYVFKGQPEQARLEREFIEVAGGQRVELAQWVTRHGPLFVVDGEERLTLRWAAAEPGVVRLPILEIDRARNWQEFRAAVAKWRGPAFNFVYADVDGNIGYQVGGALPVRRKHRGDVPADGASGEAEWEGFIPFEELPQAYNPASGMIVTANQNPFPADYRYAVNGNFAPPDRQRQIRDLLGARGQWKAEEMLAVQTDVYSGFSQRLAGELTAAHDRRKPSNPILPEPVRLLRDWNGQMHQDMPAPFLAAIAYQHLRKAAAESAAPGKGLAYEFSLAPAALERLLRERPSGWFRDWDEMLVRVLVDAVEECGRMQGSDPKRWRYGAYLRVSLVNPVVQRVPWIGPWFNVRNAPMSGSTTSVKQTTWRLGPSMRMTADPGDWDRSLLNLPLGQSGQVLSWHYRDQWKHYYAGRSFPMQFSKVDAPDVLELRPSQ
jgi:penicillin G amidase